MENNTARSTRSSTALQGCAISNSFTSCRQLQSSHIYSIYFNSNAFLLDNNRSAHVRGTKPSSCQKDGWFAEKLLLPQGFENRSNVHQMVFPRSTEDQNVIQEHHNETPQVGAQYIAHERLEGGRCIAETKAHDSELEMSKRCVYCCLWNVTDAHLVIT